VSDRADSVKNIYMIYRLYGDHNQDNVDLATTKWYHLPADVGLQREQELIQHF
jgi:hypothetical protein